MRTECSDRPAHEDPAFASYLEQVTVAVLGRDVPLIRRLMGHPLARGLPRVVREEALVVTRAPGSLRAPIHTLGFFHRISQLMRDDGLSRPADDSTAGWMSSDSFDDTAADSHEPADSRIEPDPWQMELFGEAGGRPRTGA